MEEAFSGRKPYVTQFRFFGALVYYHVSKNSREKLQPIVDLVVFLGRTTIPHNYRVFLPSLRMIVVKRYVNFDKENAMRCSL